MNKLGAGPLMLRSEGNPRDLQPQNAIRRAHAVALVLAAVLAANVTSQARETSPQLIEFAIKVGAGLVEWITSNVVYDDDLDRPYVTSTSGRRFYIHEGGYRENNTGPLLPIESIGPRNPPAGYLMAIQTLTGGLPKQAIEDFIKFAAGSLSLQLDLCQIAAPPTRCGGAPPYRWRTLPWTGTAHIGGHDVPLQFDVHIGSSQAFEATSRWVVVVENRTDRQLLQDNNVSYFHIRFHLNGAFVGVLPDFTRNHNYQALEVPPEIMRDYEPPTSIAAQVVLVRSHLFRSDETLGVVGSLDQVSSTPLQIVDGPTVQWDTTTAASIRWTTDQLSSAAVHLGMAGTTSVEVVKGGVAGHEHRVVLPVATMDRAATYRYRVESTGADGGVVVSDEETFSLESLIDLSGPSISDVTVIPIGSESARITWTTDEYSTGMAIISSDVGVMSTLLQPHLARTHEVFVGGLKPGLAYHTKIRATDAFGNTTESNGPEISLSESAVPIGGFKPVRNGAWTFTIDPTVTPAVKSDERRIEIDSPGRIVILATAGEQNAPCNSHLAQTVLSLVAPSGGTVSSTSGTCGAALSVQAMPDPTELGSWRVVLSMPQSTVRESISARSEFYATADGIFDTDLKNSENAASIAANGVTHGFLAVSGVGYDNYGGDVDWYRVAVPQPGRLRVRVTGLTNAMSAGTGVASVAVLRAGHAVRVQTTPPTVARPSVVDVEVPALEVDTGEVGDYEIRVQLLSVGSGDDSFTRVYSLTPYTLTTTFEAHPAAVYAAEPNDAAEAATRVTLGTSVAGYLAKQQNNGYDNYGGDVDWYRVAVPQPGRLRVRVTGLTNAMSAGTGVASVAVLRAGHAVRVQTTPPTVARPSVVDVEVPALEVDTGEVGDYEIRVQLLSVGSGDDSFTRVYSLTPYTLTTTFEAHPAAVYAAEPNDAAEAATRVTLGTSVAGYLAKQQNNGYDNYGGDVDWYRVAVPQPGRLRVRVTGLTNAMSAGTGVASVAVLRAGHAVRVQTTPPTVARPSVVDVEVPALEVDTGEVGDYEIRVQLLSVGSGDDSFTRVYSLTPYTLTTTFEAHPAAVYAAEPNDAAEAATRVTLGTSVAGYLAKQQNNGYDNYGGDVDWYRVAVPQPGRLRVRVTGLTNAMSAGTGVASVAVLRAGHAVRVQTTPPTVARPSVVDVEVPALEVDIGEVGDYEIRVQLLSVGSGDDSFTRVYSLTPYTLTTTFEAHPAAVYAAEPNDAAEAATRVTLGTSVAGYLAKQQNNGYDDYGGDVDWYRVAVPQPGRLRVRVTGLTNAMSAGTGVASVAVLRAGHAVRVQTTPPTVARPSVVDVEVPALEVDTGEVGDYEIRVQLLSVGSGDDSFTRVYSLTPYTLTAILETEPEIAVSPLDRAATVNRPATFGVVASGNPEVSYHWQVSSDFGVSWADLTSSGPYAGSSTDTLTVTPTDRSISGSRYRCVVSNSVGSSTSSSAILTVTPATPMALVWKDEFDGRADTEVDRQRWRYSVGTSYPGGPARWGTQEIETMTDHLENVRHDGAGRLLITPVRAGPSPTQGWTSGRVESNLAFHAPEGGILAVEASIQQPNVSGNAAAGYWAAFWMLGAPFRADYWSWPRVGEIDIMEAVNGLGTTFATFHCGISPNGPCNEPVGRSSGPVPCPNCQSSLRTYRIELDRSMSPAQIRWYLDGVHFFTVRADQVDATAWQQATHHGFFLILNVAIGGDFPAAFGGGPTSETTPGIPMVVDYVRVYQDPAVATAPSIGVNPIDRAVLAGGATTFEVLVDGIPAPAYRWQMSVDNGGTYTDLHDGGTYSGVTTSTLGLAGVPLSAHGAFYRVVASNEGGSTVSSPARLTVQPPDAAPVFSAQPVDRLVLSGRMANFSVTVVGSPAPALRWQVSTNSGASFSDLSDVAPYSGTTTATLTITAAAAELNGHHYRVVATNVVDSATSTAATLTVQFAPAITTPPANRSINAGQNSIFTVVATGNPAPTYRWQVSTNSGTSFSDLSDVAPYSGTATATLTITGAAVALNGHQYRVVATNVVDAATSAAATLTVQSAPAITTPPANRTINAGQNTTFTVVATGNPAPTYRWQLSANSGTSFSDLSDVAPYSGTATATLTITGATAALNGHQYRVVATNVVDAATSAAATLTVQSAPAIATPPANRTINAGQNTTVTAAATGTPSPTYRWQVSTNSGASFSDLSDVAPYSGTATATLTITAAAAELNGHQYRVVATNVVDSATSAAATLTVQSAPAITTPPANRTINAGQNTTFAAVATGTPAPAYRWQVSTNSGSSFSDLSDVVPYSGTTTASLTITGAAADLNGHQYRVVATNVVDAATSTAATLTVQSAPAVTTPPTNRTINAGENTMFTVVATGNPAPTYRWQVSTDGGTSYTDLSDGAPYSGAQTATLTITGATAGLNGHQYRVVATNVVDAATSIAATLTVQSAPTITTPPANRTINAGQDTTFTVAATGTPAPTYRWQVSTNSGTSFADLPDVAPYSGTATATLTITGAAVDLNGHQYRVVATNVVDSATSPAATLTVRLGPAFSTHPASTTITTGGDATFSVAVTGTPTPTVLWQVSTNGGATFANLTDTAPYSGVSTSTLAVTAAPLTLHGARYRAVATNAAGTVASDAAVLNVRGNARITPATLRFAGVKTGPSLTSVTAPQTVTVNFHGASSAWSVTSTVPWLSVLRGADTGAGTFEVRVVNPDDVIGLVPELTGALVVSSPMAPQTSTTVPVTLSLTVVTLPPFGQVDTPMQNAGGVQAAIGVTGWALDDLGVASVQVFRNCLAYEEVPGGNCQTILEGTPQQARVVFVGDAAFLEGARPDVEGGFGFLPQASRGGWGMLVLTPMLPDVTRSVGYGGVGSLTLFVVATDVEGHKVLLGRSSDPSSPQLRTPTQITMANESTAKPFGSIDTPLLGQTISGVIPNFGWSLTPDTNTTAGPDDVLIPTNGSTMWVFIDDLPVANVVYNQCRGTGFNSTTFCNDDVSNIFGNPTPQPVLQTRTSNPTLYRNLDVGRGPIGAYVLDTRSLSNGLHTIAWSVTDSLGRVEGIGSRFFTVLNSGADQFGGAEALALQGGSDDAQRRARALAPPHGVWGRTGFDLRTEWVEMHARANGRYQVRLPEVGRLELLFGTPVDSGHLVAPDGTLRELPVGSSLSGTRFGWAVPIGFHGPYHLMFMRGGERVDVDVTVAPLGRPDENASEIRMHLDLVRVSPGPLSSSTLLGAGERSVRIEGWAYDPQAALEAGIGAVHVWATQVQGPGSRVQGSAPVFIGEATLSVARPAVAQAHGDAPGHAGFTLMVTLAPGTYEFTAYVWNVRTARWEDARTVIGQVR